MSTVTFNGKITHNVGGTEVVLFDWTSPTNKQRARTVSTEIIYDKTVSLANGGGTEALFNAALASDDQMAAFTVGIIIVDPLNAYADDAAGAVVSLDFTGDGVDTPSIEVRREFPFIFSSSGAGGPAGGGTIDGAITKIDATNAGAAAVKVRIILFK